jgi:hypothetical protein
MKKLIILLLFTISAFAQPSITKNSLPINKENNCMLRYLYFPNMQVYLDQKRMIYLLRQKIDGVYTWVEKEELPEGYAGYSVYNTRYVVIDNYDDDDIIKFFDEHRKKFPYYKSNTRVNR